MRADVVERTGALRIVSRGESGPVRVQLDAFSPFIPLDAEDDELLKEATVLPAAAEPVWVVEGRVAVEVPADWKVERVTTGPGSARLQVVSPSDPKAAIHLTQSVVPKQQSLATAAEVLRNSLAAQPEGVFVDFTVADRQADRAAITYREVRPGHLVDWTVLLDGGVRIAVGCQSARDRGWPAWICERAIRSARVVA